MNSFLRALVPALRYRWTFAGSVFCALMVGVLWGGNIGTVYPFFEVAFQGQSLHQWADKQIAAIDAEIAQLAQQLAAADRPPADRRQAERVAARLADQQASRGRYLWLQQHVIDPYLPDDPFQTLVLVAGLLLLGTTAKSLFLIGHQILVGRLSQLAVLDLRKAFFRRALEGDVTQFSSEGASELMSRFTYDMESLSTALNELFGKLVREPLKMLACLVGAALVCWRLLLLSLVLAPLAALLIRWLARVLKKANRRAMEEMSHMYNILDETFQGIKVVKAFTMERHERRRFHYNSKKYYLKWMRIARYDSLTRPLTELLGIATICMALLAGAYLVINQQTHLLGVPMCDQPLSLGALLVFYGLLAGTSDPARKLSEVFSRIQRGAAASERIYAALDRQVLVVDPPRPVPLARHRRELLFDRVGFRYQPQMPVLEDVSLRIGFGQTVAIVGPNGCGKSTLASLVPRFFDPQQGRVLLDGVDLRQVRLRDLRSQIGLVTQETLLFDDTVFNNIRYGSSQATRQQVIDAARRAHAHRFIEERLEHGYDTVVGPRGSMLSGGQRQRIALARAILRDPAILILDEATSQIDLESEQVIHRVLEQFIRDRTTIIITHRMSTLALADHIVVMNAGRILDAGSHDELLRRCDLYRRLHDLQFREIA